MAEFNQTRVVRSAQVTTMVGWQPQLTSVVKVTFEVYDGPEESGVPEAFAMTARDGEILGMALLETAQGLREEVGATAWYRTIAPDDPKPALTAWLERAAVGIAVMDTTVRPHSDPLYVVEVNNGLGGHAGMGSYIAWCNNKETAELVGAALWALLREQT